MAKVQELWYGEQPQQKEESPSQGSSSFIGQFAAGYIEGLTTFDILGNMNIEGKPQDTSEQIARSFGSVLGFVGFGWGSLAKVGYSTTAKAFKLLGNLEKAKDFAQSASLITPTLKSLPMMAGSFASKGVMRMLETDAAKSALKLGEEVTGIALGDATKGFIHSATESALFMGFASAAGARPLNPLEIFTEDNFKDRWESFKSAVPQGAAFGVLGSVFSADTMKKLGITAFTELEKPTQDFLLKSMRGVSAGLAMGGYALAEGYPTELALYESLVNGVFGYRELPWYDKEAMHLMQKHNVNDRTFAEWSADPRKKMSEMENGHIPEQVMDSFELSFTAYYGSQTNNKSYWENVFHDAGAKIYGVSKDQVTDKDPITMAIDAKLYPEAANLMAVKMREEALQKHEDELVRSYQELYKENPTDEAMETIKEEAEIKANKTLSEGPTPGQIVEMLALHSDIRSYNDVKTVAQIQQFNETMRGIGEVPGRIIDVALDMSEMFKEQNINPIDATLTMGKVFRENKEKDQIQYASVKSSIEKTLGITLGHEQDRELKVLWSQFATARPVDVRVYDVKSNTALAQPRTSKTGEAIGEFSVPSFVERMLDRDFVVVKNISVGAKTLSVNDDANNKSLMQYEMFKKDLMYHGSKKDDNKDMYVPNVDIKQDERGTFQYRGQEFNLAQELSEVDTILNRNIRTYNAAHPELLEDDRPKIRPFGKGIEEYQVDRKRWTDEVFKGKQPNDAQLKLAENAFDTMYAFQTMTYKEFTSVQKLHELYADPQSFAIQNAVDANKRRQVMYDGNPTLEESVVGTPTISSRIIVWDKRSDGLFPGFEKTQEDGVMLITKSLADRIGTEGGFSKMSIASKGGLIGKLGAHVLTPSEEKVFRDAGLTEDSFMHESAAKQTGKVERTYVHYSKEKGLTHDAGQPVISIDPDSQLPISSRLPKAFDIPVNDIRINYNVAEDTQMKSISIIKQMLTGLDGEMATWALNEFGKKQYFGDEVKTIEGAPTSAQDIEAKLQTNTERFKSAEGTHEDFTVDLDKVAIPELFKVLTTLPNDIRLKKLVDYLVHAKLEHGDEDLDEVAMLKEFRRAKTPVLDAITVAGETAYAPPFLAQEHIYKFLEQALYKVAQDRLQRPEWTNSMKSRIGYLSPIELSQRPYFNEKSIMFGDKMREKPIEFNGKWTTLGKLWDMPRTPEIQDFFDTIVNGRVPQSDISGARVLQFKGFIDGGGWKSFIHPFQMKYIDGADLDGDSMVHYFGMPKKLTDYLQRPEIEHRFTEFDSITKLPKDVHPSIGGDPNLNSTVDSKLLKEPLGMFSPYQLSLANKIANVGKSTLGPGLTGAGRAKLLQRYLEAKKEIEIHIGKGKDEQTFYLRPKADRTQQRRTQVDIVNRAADAASGVPPASVDRVRAANILSVADVYDAQKKLLPNDVAMNLFSARQTPYQDYQGKSNINFIPIVDALAKLDFSSKAMDFDGNPRDLGTILRDMNTSSERLRKIIGDNIELGNTWYDSLLLMNDTIKHDIEFGSFLNPISHKITMESMNALMKSKDGLEGIVANVVKKVIGRSGLSFNISKLSDSEIWRSKIVPKLRELQSNKRTARKDKDGRTWEQYYLNDFINSKDISQSALFKFIEKFPALGNSGTEDLRQDVMAELAKNGLFVNSHIVQYDDNALTATWKEKTGEVKTWNFDRYPTRDANEQDFYSDWRSNKPGVTIDSKRRSKYDQVKESNKLVLKGLADLASVNTMIDAITPHLRNEMKEGHVKEENIEQYITEKIEPFLDKIAVYRKRLVESQQKIVQLTGGTPEKKATAFKSYEATVKEINDYRNKLDEFKKPIFDATFLSSMQPTGENSPRSAMYNEHIQEVEKFKKVFRADPKNKELSSEEIFNMAKNAASGSAMSYEKFLYGGEYAMTPFSAGIVDQKMVKEYYNYFNKVATAMMAPPENFDPEVLYDRFNLVPRTLIPIAATTQPDAEKMITRPVNDKIARTFLSNVSKGMNRDALGKIKDHQERAWYEDRRVKAVNILANHPEMYDELHLILPSIFAERTKGKIHRTLEFSTKNDIDFFIALLENDGKALKNFGIKWTDFVLQFPAFAERLKRYGEKYDMQTYAAHVTVPDAEGKPTPIDMNVKKLMAPLDYVTAAATAHENRKNIIDDERVAIWSTVDKDDYYNKLNKLEPNLSNKLYDITVKLLEEPLAYPHLKPQGVYEPSASFEQRKLEFEEEKKKALELYKIPADQAREELAKIKDKPYRLSNKEGKTVPLSKQQLLDYFRTTITEYQKRIHDAHEDGEHDHLVKYTGKEFGTSGTLREVDLDKTFDGIFAHQIQTGIEPTISKKKMTEMAVSYFLEKTPIDIYSSERAGIFFGEYLSDEGKKEFQKKVDLANGEMTKSGPLLWKQMDDVQKNAFADKMDQAKSIFGYNLDKEYEPFGQNYFPHIELSEKKLMNHMREGLDARKVLSFADTDKTSFNVLKLISQTSNQLYDQEEGQHMFTRLQEKTDVFSTIGFTTQSERGRSRTHPLKDWNRDPFSLTTTLSKIQKENADMLFAVIGNRLLDKYREKEMFGKENTEHVTRFVERFLKQTLGFPDLLPKEYERGYQYGMKNNPFKFHSDEFWVQKIQSISDSWFGGKVNGDFTMLENLAEKMKFDTPELRKEFIEKGKRTLAEKKLSWLSQAEAKWSLLSLLTSPKTYLTNIGSGEAMTLINVGFKNWRMSRDLRGMQMILGSDNIKSLKDASRLIGFTGGLEGMYQMEGDFSPELGQQGFRELMQAFKRDGKNADVQGIFKKYGVVDKAMTMSAWFMKDSERRIREHSMLAHYFNAHEALKQQGFDLQWDDPWIIKIARDGVNASQFLYSNANRPAFMGSLIGKIFHRFQLYTYNSLVFRKNVIEQARGFGMRPGEEGYDRFQRMVATDMFVFGMASLIPMSIFGSGLMPPYNNMTAFVKFFFGSNEKDKQEAFYGGLPYPLNIMQTVTPVSMRGFIGLLNYAYSGDADALGKSIFSMMPGQRIVKDTWKAYDQIANQHRNPMQAIDTFTGIPAYSSGNVLHTMNNTRSQLQHYLNLYKAKPYLSDDKKNTEDEINALVRQYSLQ